MMSTASEDGTEDFRLDRAQFSVVRLRALELLRRTFPRAMVMCGKPNLSLLDPGVVKIHAGGPSRR